MNAAGATVLTSFLCDRPQCTLQYSTVQLCRQKLEMDESLPRAEVPSVPLISNLRT